jgi:uncharacterized pyridoxal phosphate-containing UPF0001 family protein
MDNGSEIERRLEVLECMWPRPPAGPGGPQLTYGFLAVSKLHPAEAVRALYRGGAARVSGRTTCRGPGQMDALPAEISWHFIGHLQTNKVRNVVGVSA